MKRMATRMGAAVFGLAAMVSAGCGTMGPKGSIRREPFGNMPDGTPVHLYILRNSKGVEARITDYGGTVQALLVPDRNGKMDDVVLGFDTLAEYIKDSPYFGCIVGRYANRIAGGKFTLDGKICTLAINNAPNSLHGGLKGFDKAVWEASASETPRGPALELKYLSRDGEEGFPGNLSVTAVYTLTEDNELRLDTSAVTDKPTVVNLTQHNYFNLAGKGDILGHEAMINAARFTPVDSTLIPTGELRPVAGTPLDFRTPVAIGARINQADEQMKFGGGYDHNWVIDKAPGELGLQARVTEPGSGRVMEILSTEPGLQFYTGNFLRAGLKGKAGRVHPNRGGFCMEPQHYPDSPNKPGFPTAVLRPGQTFQSTIVWRFSAR